MDIVLSIIKISEQEKDQVDYDNLIFKVEAKSIMDLNVSNYLWVTLVSLINGGVKKVLIEMRNLEFIDSSNIGVFMKAAKLLREKKGDIAFINVPSPIKRIFKPLNLDQFIKFFDTVDEARQFFRIF